TVGAADFVFGSRRPAERIGDGSPGALVRRGQLRRLPVCLAGLAVAGFEVVDATQVHVRLARRAERERLLQSAGCLLMTSEAQVDAPEVRIRRVAIRRNCEDALQLSEGVLEPPMPVVEDAQGAGRRPRVGAEMDRLQERRLGVRGLP